MCLSGDKQPHHTRDEAPFMTVAEDDAELVKDLGRSFRFSAVEAKREAKIKAAHDEAIFGTSTALPIVEEELSTEENCVKEDTESCGNLMSDQVKALLWLPPLDKVLGEIEPVNFVTGRKAEIGQDFCSDCGLIDHVAIGHLAVRNCVAMVQ
ncbi:hypothetical protein ACLOJK_000810 [Asimina triloba]